MPGEERRRQLLEVGAKVFGRYGYHPAGTADIARACGIAEPTIYRHFASKEEYFATVTREAALAVASAIREARPRGLEALEELLQDMAAGSPHLALVGHLVVEGRDPALRPVVEEALSALQEALSHLGSKAQMAYHLVLSAALLAAGGRYAPEERWAA